MREREMRARREKICDDRYLFVAGAIIVMNARYEDAKKYEQTDTHARRRGGPARRIIHCRPDASGHSLNR